MVGAIRRQPLLYEGDLIAQLQTRTPAEGASGAVRGQEQ